MTKLDEPKRAAVRPSDLLAAAAAIAAGTQAYGEVIIFINPAEGEPGHFDWQMLPGSSSPSQWLDITRPSVDQPGTLTSSSVMQAESVYCDGLEETCIWTNFTSGGAEVVADQLFSSEYWTVSYLEFSAYSQHATKTSSGEWSWVSTDFAYGEAGYIGVKFSDVDGYHYGWIGVVREGTNYSGIKLDAFAWGYETEPGVPIRAGIPAPGTLAALAFGAVVTRRGRKRKDD
jgi:hypothetical protein